MKEWLSGGLGDNNVNPMPISNFGFWKVKGTDPNSDFSYNAGTILMRDTDGYLIPHDGSSATAYVLKGDVKGKAGKKVAVGMVAIGVVNLTAYGDINDGDFVDIHDAANGVVAKAAPADVDELYKIRGKALQNASDGDRLAIMWGVL